MKDKLYEYIKQNQVCSELIFKDWEAFLQILFKCGGSVSKILWFEYVSIDEQNISLGAGGYRDQQDPGYMWAETTIYAKDLSSKSLVQIKQYITDTIVAYRPHNLVPCFFEIIV